MSHTSRSILMALLTVTAIVQAAPARATAIDPRSVTWNIVSDRDMSKLCRDHGLRANCEGMAAWDHEIHSCVIWTRSPRGSDDGARWQVVHHELLHCQEGHFHQD
jgi:hypothetical protein